MVSCMQTDFSWHGATLLEQRFHYVPLHSLNSFLGRSHLLIHTRLELFGQGTPFIVEVLQIRNLTILIVASACRIYLPPHSRQAISIVASWFRELKSNAEFFDVRVCRRTMDRNCFDSSLVLSYRQCEHTPTMRALLNVPYEASPWHPIYAASIPCVSCYWNASCDTQLSYSLCPLLRRHTFVVYHDPCLFQDRAVLLLHSTGSHTVPVVHECQYLLVKSFWWQSHWAHSTRMNQF